METAETDAQGGATSYIFDVRNLLLSETLPDMGVKKYSYDAAHRITSRIDQENIATTYLYDRINRMTTRAYPDNLNDLFAYDNVGRLLSATSQRYNNVVTRNYDLAGRMLQEQLNVGAATYNLDYGYDADNRQTSVVYPNGDVVTRRAPCTPTSVETQRPATHRFAKPRGTRMP
jgi:YD repeat-containing protein